MCGHADASIGMCTAYTAMAAGSMEDIMARKFIDCREFPSEKNCSVTIAADSENELLDAAAQHAAAVHGHEDTPQFRQQLRGLIREGSPPA
jgi:predicted small metal-binding protein